MMHRIILIFMLLMLPLQTSWAAVAVYCKHETGASAKHIGHHEHVHKGGAGEKDGKKLATVDPDCSVCHFTMFSNAGDIAQVVVEADAGEHNYSVAFRSYSPPGPERPDRRLAS